ncbi:MAG TPA: hypothetical protein VGT41_00600 [Candidatus Babeliales bacterium]|nr:hypothetical protein [Candidatus Babeliales bacterium]
MKYTKLILIVVTLLIIPSTQLFSAESDADLPALVQHGALQTPRRATDEEIRYLQPAPYTWMENMLRSGYNPLIWAALGTIIDQLAEKEVVCHTKINDARKFTTLYAFVSIGVQIKRFHTTYTEIKRLEADPRFKKLHMHRQIQCTGHSH